MRSHDTRRQDRDEPRGERPQPAPPHALLGLQRSVGNQGVVSLLARQKKAKAKAPTSTDIDVDDAAGTIKSTAGELIGFKTADGAWYATPGAAAPAAARMGDLETSAGKLPILK